MMNQERQFLFNKAEFQPEEESDEEQQQQQQQGVQQQNYQQNLPQLQPTLIQDSDFQINGQLYSLRGWWITLEGMTNSSYEERANIYEKALKYLPRSYKLWHNYLQESMVCVNNTCILSYKFEHINKLFERALIFMNKMPRIWLLYCQFLEKQKFVTQTRRTYDKALQSLPVPQHEKIWSQYIEFIYKTKCLKSIKYAIRRYLKFNPDYKEEYVQNLLDLEDYNEACLTLVQILDDEGYASPNGKSKYEFTLLLCKIISEQPEQIKDIDCDAVIRYSIKRYTDEVGNLWVSLANFYIRQGLFERARDIFEESLENIITARDFGIIYNAYVKFEEEMLNILQYNNEAEKMKDLQLENEINQELEILAQDTHNMEVEQQDEELEIEYKIFRLEKLLERRALLLNNCLLRQNPNNVDEWIKRLKLVQEDDGLLVKTFGEALTQIDPQRATKGLDRVWIMFAELYKNNGDLKHSNLIYFKAIKVPFKTLEELTNIWSSWVEMHIQLKNYQDAITIIKMALFKRPNRDDKSQHAQSLTHSLKLWTLYLDLELNFGTFETIKSAYKRAIDLKVATPITILNFANYLHGKKINYHFQNQKFQVNKYYEECFKAYEAGISLFNWPALYEIWIIYLERFTERYKSEKIERARDLYDKVLSSCPNDKCMIFFLMNASMEEKYGLLNHAVEVYDRMVEVVPYQQKMDALNIYIVKVAEYLGVTKTRHIFEKGIKVLKDKEKISLGLRFAELERKLGEIDRARAIYNHICQFCDPKDDEMKFWTEWDKFEVLHGNEDTYKEFMRIKRSVLAKYAIIQPSIQEIQEKVNNEEIKAK